MSAKCDELKLKYNRTQRNRSRSRAKWRRIEENYPSREMSSAICAPLHLWKQREKCEAHVTSDFLHIFHSGGAAQVIHRRNIEVFRDCTKIIRRSEEQDQRKHITLTELCVFFLLAEGRRSRPRFMFYFNIFLVRVIVFRVCIWQLKENKLSCHNFCSCWVSKKNIERI